VTEAAVDAAIDRLAEAHRQVGLPPIRPAGDVGKTLVEIRSDLAPTRLPDEVEVFWRRVDPESMSLAPYPHPTSPDFALQSWRSHQDESPGMTPRLLFPVCYESQGFLFVELADDLGSGGAVLEWAYAGSPFYVRFPSLAAYIDLLAEMIEQRQFTLHRGHGLPWYEFDPEGRWPQAQAAALSAAQPLPGFGVLTEIEEDVRQWPERWLRSNGLTPEHRRPRGASTTVADLLRDAASGGPATGTVQGRVVSLVGSGRGCRVGVDDGTAVLDLWCPAAVTTYGPVMGREFEFDVLVRSDAATLDATAFGTPAAAEATAIRPMD
jgi:hypothetical protein